MDKYNKKENKKYKYKERKSTPQYNFQKDFIQKVNLFKNNNEQIRGSVPVKKNEKEQNPYIEKKKYILPKNKKNIRDLSSKNELQNKLFYNIPSNRIKTAENNNNHHKIINKKVINNKSIPKFKKVNYVEIYKRVNNKELIRNNVPLIHINLSRSIKHKSKNESENESKENIISNQTLKSPKELNIENKKFNKIPRAKKEKKEEEEIKKLYLDYCYKEDPNILSRQKMEDFHKIIPNLSKNPIISYFAIFDGHSGEEPAIYCQNHLHEILLNTLKLNDFNIEKSLLLSFQQIDDEISKEDYNEESGSTATILLIFEKLNEKYYACANVGDTQCYLIKKNSVIKLSKDHKCSNKEEVERIKKNGGMVFNNRVFGSLMLTRSIGDREMKNYGVCSIPFINLNKINDDDLFFIIASDGVWDVINQNDISHICNYNKSSKEICEEIIHKSINDGTKDNVSCIVVKL